MNENRDALINRLAAESGTGQSRLHVPRLAGTWLLLGTLMAATFSAVVEPYRPGFLEQLLTVPRFTLEMALGAGAIAALVMAVLRLAVPGVARPVHFISAAALTLLWVGMIVLSLFSPALDLGTLGARTLCWVETFLYGLPVMALGFVVAGRGYVLHWVPAGLLIGLVSGFFPGLIMQLACMYQAKHDLIAHIGPALPLAVIGGVIGLILAGRRASR
ncbi:MAG TPA: NrsF family protein [Desulfurivibrionaceae bacterium]|nr:NrsF family protein [Desulfurivibrionaceae bacterium]